MISQERKKLIILGIIFFIVMSISGVYAVGSEVNNGNVLSTGGVNIELVEYTKNEEEKEVIYNKITEKVKPGQEISLIEKIKNLGAECYVRAKITVSGINIENINDFIKEMPEGWEKIGDYFYHKDELAPGTETTIFGKIIIPVDLPNEVIDTDIELKVVVDAVQSRNFEPNYNEEDPWDNVEIEMCVDNKYSIDDSSEKNKITIEYENDTQKDITVSDTFLDNLQKAMPGDEIAEHIQLKNTNKKKARYYLKIETGNPSDREQELLKNIQVKITNKDGNVVYQGSLMNLNNGVQIGEYNLNENDLLDLKIDILKDLKNANSIINPSLKWKFYAEYEEQDSKRKSSNPKTGDFNFYLSLLLFFISATGLVIVFILMNVDNRKNRNNI